MSFLNLFGDGDKQENSTTNNTDGRTQSWNDSHNETSNLTLNDTNTLTQDRRLVNDGGVGVSADSSTVAMTNSGNSSTSTTTSNAFTTINTTTDFGSVAIGGDVAKAAIKSNQELSLATVDASKYLVNSGASMYRTSLDYAQHLADNQADLALKVTQDANAEARNAIREVVANSNNALTQLMALASKPLDANDPQRVVIIVGLCVVGIVFFSKMK
jgi:hypothetical protein